MLKYLKSSILLTLSCFLLLTACEKTTTADLKELSNKESTTKKEQAEHLNAQEPFKNKIFQRMANGNLVLIQEATLVKQWKNDKYLSDDQEIGNFHITTDIDAATGEHVLLLRGESTEQTQKFAAELTYDNTISAFVLGECVCGCFVQNSDYCGGTCDPIQYGNSCDCNTCYWPACSAFRLCNHQ